MLKPTPRNADWIWTSVEQMYSKVAYVYGSRKTNCIHHSCWKSVTSTMNANWKTITITLHTTITLHIGKTVHFIVADCGRMWLSCAGKQISMWLSLSSSGLFTCLKNAYIVKSRMRVLKLSCKGSVYPWELFMVMTILILHDMSPVHNQCDIPSWKAVADLVVGF